MKILLILDAISLKKNAQLFSVNKELLLIQPRPKDLPLYSPEVHTFVIKLDFLANAFRRRLEFGCTVYNLCDRIMRAHECLSQVNWSLIVVSKKKQHVCSVIINTPGHCSRRRQRWEIKKKLIDLYHTLDVNSTRLDPTRSLSNAVDHCCSKSNKNGILKAY